MSSSGNDIDVRQGGAVAHHGDVVGLNKIDNSVEYHYHPKTAGGLVERLIAKLKA